MVYCSTIGQLSYLGAIPVLELLMKRYLGLYPKHYKYFPNLISFFYYGKLVLLMLMKCLKNKGIVNVLEIKDTDMFHLHR